MAISPDGKWLFTVNATGATMAEYPVNPSTGNLSASATFPLPVSTSCVLVVGSPTSQACSVTVAQSGSYVVASLGISGDQVYPFNSTNGITGVYTIPSGYPAVAVGNYSTAINGSNYAFVEQTDAISAYVLQGTGGYTGPSTVPFPVGTAPRSLVLNPAGTLVYTANEKASTISGFSVVNGGGLTEISGSPTAGPANVSAISVDNTGGYLVAVGYDATKGVQLYTISSTGALASVAQAGSGTSEAYPALVATTH